MSGFVYRYRDAKTDQCKYIGISGSYIGMVNRINAHSKEKKPFYKDDIIDFIIVPNRSYAEMMEGHLVTKYRPYINIRKFDWGEVEECEQYLKCSKWIDYKSKFKIDPQKYVDDVQKKRKLRYINEMDALKHELEFYKHSCYSQNEIFGNSIAFQCAILQTKENYKKEAENYKKQYFNAKDELQKQKKKRKVSFIMKIITLITALSVALSGMTVSAEKYAECRVTAYSGNNGSTYGASMRTLQPGKSCAACDCIPLGSYVYVEDFGVLRVDDRMSEDYAEKHDHAVLDLYLQDYETACEWGARQRDVYIIRIDKGE